MKALEVIEESDPQGTVIGIRRVVDWPPSRRPITLRLLGLAIAVLLLTFVCPQKTDAAEDNTVILHESGHFSGSGYHELSASGPLCSIIIQPANDSIVWRVLSNGTLLGAI